jgi:tetratricopeptide (TPR) repeat protein
VKEAMVKATEDSDMDILIDMIPALGSPFEDRDRIPESRGTTRSNSENPSITLFCKFLSEFFSSESPIMLLLDDLQWLDSSSLKLLRAIVLTENLRGFMLMGTCRGDEVAISHPLSFVLRSLEEERVLVTNRSGMLCGDFEMAFVNYINYSCNGLFPGLQLEEHLEKMTQIRQYYSWLQQDTVMFYLLCFIQLARNMLGKAEDTHILPGEDFDAESGERENADLSTSRTCQLFLALYLGDYHRAAEIGKNIQSSNNDAMPSFTLQTMHFMSGLSEVLEAREADRKKSKAGRAALEKLRKWAKCAPDNALGRLYLIEAEQDALKYKRDRSLRKFRSAIDYFCEQGFLHEQALACELAAASLVGWGKRVDALRYYEQAIALYQEWGSPAKVEQVSEKIAQL